MSVRVTGQPALPAGRFPIALALWLGATPAPPAQGPDFWLVAEDPAYAHPGVLGNGSVGVVTHPLGTGPAPWYAVGVYDHGPGDVPRIARLPAWTELDLEHAGAWLNAESRTRERLLRYVQVLDMYDGVLRTSYEWVRPGGPLGVRVESFVSRADPRLGVVRLEVRAPAPTRVRVAATLHGWPPPPRLPLAELRELRPEWTQADLWYPGHVRVTDATADPAPPQPWGTLEGTTEGRGTRVAEAMILETSQPPASSVVARAPPAPGVRLELAFDLAPDRPLVVIKYVGIASSWETADPLTTARSAAGTARARGYPEVRRAHAAAWHRLWERDIVVEGDPELQRVVRGMWFTLLGSVRAGTDFSIPPMGLSGAGYYGHIFWDADTYMFPPLLVLHPELARALVAFRARTLPAARERARRHGYRGALYPWESDERGEETTPRFAEQNALMEHHIVGDVALAQWQYVLVTDDTAYLARAAFPVLAAAADFWASRASYDPDADRYEIRGLVSVQEGFIGVSNETYTNAVARRTLRAAAEAARRLGRAPDPAWLRVAERLYLPFDSVRQAHPPYEGAPPERYGEVAPLLHFPLEIGAPEVVKRNDLEGALRLLERRGGGALMGSAFLPILAAELGDRTLFDRLVPATYRPWLRGPFLALAETPEAEIVHFVTGAGAFLQQVLFGYTGLRLGAGGLEPRYPPMLPAGVRRLVIRGALVRGRPHDVVVEGTRVRFVPHPS